MSQNEIQIPNDYGSWKGMITGQCKETLSQSFIEERLKVLSNKSDPFTKKFVEVYGQNYTDTVISWFNRAKNDIV